MLVDDFDIGRSFFGPSEAGALARPLMAVVVAPPVAGLGRL